MDRHAELEPSIRCGVARYLESAPVPPFPREEVERGLAGAVLPVRPRGRWRLAAAAGAVGLALATAAFAVPEVRVLVARGAQAVALHAAEARAREHGFVLVRPAGLPADARLVRVETLGGDGAPLMVVFRYARASGGEFALVESRDLGEPASPALMAGADGRGRLVPSGLQSAPAGPPSWVVGDTRVTVLHAGSLTTDEVEAIRSAMGGR